MKLCPCCGTTKELAAFRVRANGRPQSHCKACDNARSAAWQKTNKDRAREITQRYDATHRDQRKAASRAGREGNREAVTRWRTANRDTHRAAVAAWRDANPAKLRAAEAKRRAVRLHAVPPWVDLVQVQGIYAEAARMRRAGENVHVDHDIPLQGANVCGLHVETNLRIVPAAVNLAKGNKFLAA